MVKLRRQGLMEKEIKFYESRKELKKLDAELVSRAADAVADAYAPYSNFYVGAAVLLDTGEIIKGSNFENASYPLCLCAERVALGSVHSQYPKAKVISIAVTAKNPKQKVTEPVAPCGACRQVLLEYEQRQGVPLQVIMFGETGKVVIYPDAQSLLPMAFGHKFLG